MEFDIHAAEQLEIEDSELSALMTQVYVDGGFTDVSEAKSLFDPAAIRQRGLLIGARDKKSTVLAGIIILVPPESTARRLAQNNEAEIHLLGVKSEYRGHGLGRSLVTEAIIRSKQKRYQKIILWTQDSMKAAQSLYESVGFVYAKNIEKNGRTFKVYNMDL